MSKLSIFLYYGFRQAQRKRLEDEGRHVGLPVRFGGRKRLLASLDLDYLSAMKLLAASCGVSQN
jgi:hypothetical protein